MRRVFFRVLLISTTFTIATAFTGLIDWEVERRAENSVRNLHVPVVFPVSRLSDMEDPQVTEIINSLGVGEFYPYGHACGNGFTTGYFAAGRQRLSHSFRAFQDTKAARQHFFHAIGSASELIHHPEPSSDDGKISTRAFARYESDDGSDYFAITWIQRGGNGYHEIVGPDDDTTLYLEVYVKRKE